MEDDILVRHIVTELLNDKYEVLEAADADEAVTFLMADHHVDLVLSDIRMPGTMDGLELAQWLGDHYPDLPVILVSGDVAANQESEDCRLRRWVMSKPYNHTRLLFRIADILALRDESTGHLHGIHSLVPG